MRLAMFVPSGPRNTYTPCVSYERPVITIEGYRDSDGQVIPYGCRWENESGFRDSPPDWAYSKLGHDQRFDVVVQVGQALVSYLAESYAVDVSADGTRTTLTPFDPVQSPLTIDADFERHHVNLKAGFSFEVDFPSCGCQACDDDALDLLDELECVTLAVVSGRFTERLSGRWLRTEVVFPDGGIGREVKIDRAKRKLFKSQFEHNTRQWKPWTRKQIDSA